MAEMEQSILKSTKKILGVGPDDESFDLDILTHVNASFATLQQLGLGPDDEFSVEDEEPVWADFFGDDPVRNQVKTYVYLKTRMLFDPPTTQHLIAATEKQIQELEWRLNEVREGEEWADPDPPTPEDVYEDIFGD